jgi:hypothetical protein
MQPEPCPICGLPHHQGRVGYRGYPNRRDGLCALCGKRKKQPMPTGGGWCRICRNRYVRLHQRARS